MLTFAIAPYITGMPGSHANHLRRIVPAQKTVVLAQLPSSAPIGTPHLLNSLVVILPYLTIAVVAYLLGSIPSAYILMRAFRKKDIRTLGSGNVGATNVVRTGGYGLGVVTFLCDVLKGCAAVWLGAILAAHFAPAITPMDAKAVAALFAVVGHLFTFWLRFHGGKGVATGFGVFLVIAPWAALAALGVFALTTAISRYVAVGSILGSASFPVFAWFFLPGSHRPFFISVVAIVPVLIILKHHSNIGRLVHGTEFKIGDKEKE